MLKTFCQQFNKKTLITPCGYMFMAMKIILSLTMNCISLEKCVATDFFDWIFKKIKLYKLKIVKTYFNCSFDVDLILK